MFANPSRKRGNKMAKKRKHYRRRNPPLGGIVKRVVKVSPMDAGLIAAGAVLTKAVKNFLPVQLTEKVPAWALEGLTALGLGFIPKYGKELQTGGLVSLLIGVLSRVSGGKLGTLKSETDMELSGLGLASFRGLGDLVTANAMFDGPAALSMAGAFPQSAY